jgi:hypothetical protein
MHHRLTSILIGLSLMSSAVASANLVNNPGFETGDFTGWTQSGNTEFTFVDGDPHSGTQAAWLGPQGSRGFLSQTLATVPGETYELQYWLQHDPFGAGTPNVFQISWGGSFITNQMDVGTFLYTDFVFSDLIPTGTSTELAFGFREDTDFFQLDDVSVEAAAQAVPEPATLLLLGAAVLLLVSRAPRLRRLYVAGAASVVLVAGATPTQGQITDFTPEGIRQFLASHADVTTIDKFLQNMPLEFHYNWIMMTNSESAQTGTATSPRFIMFDFAATRVFGFALDSQTIEYLHFEDTTNKFRFHEIELQAGGGTISIDEARCLGCHASTRRDASGGLHARLRRPRPNWDAYDSWGGALPFNRDRIYQNSEEEKAVKRILNDIKTTPFGLQIGFPPGIQDNVTTGTVTTDFTNCDPGIDTTDDPCKTDIGNGRKFLRVQSDSPGKGTKTDEGRGVALFDLLTDLNAKRIAQELADFPPNPVDIRPVALAIVSDCLTAATLGKYAPKAALTKLLAYHTGLDPTIKTFPDLLDDTRKRMHSLPKLKADLQLENLNGLIAANGSAGVNPQAEMALRSNKNPGVTFEVDATTGFMIDRELYDRNNEVLKMALFRLFLEPLGVAVETWSMSVKTSARNDARNATYTFGDLFQSQYVPVIQSMLMTTVGGDRSCSGLSAASIKQYVRPF